MGSSLGQKLEQFGMVQEEHTQQLSDHEHRLIAMCERVYQLESESSKWKEEREKWLANPPASFAPHSTATPVASNAFDRPADPTRFLVSGGGKDIARANVWECLLPLLEKANVPQDQVSILGKGIRKKFPVCIEGSNAPRLVEQFIDSLKDDNGKWIPVHMPDAAGAVSRVYISKDRSPKQEKTEVLTGAMARIIRGALGDRAENFEVFASKSAGTVNVDWVPVACIELPTDKDVLLQWNIPELEKLGLDKSQLAQTFQDGGRKRANIPWSL